MPTASASIAGSRAIPDNSFLWESVRSDVIPTSARITSVSVNLNITHPNVSDLDIYLYYNYPEGLHEVYSESALSLDNGGSGDNYVGTTFTTTSANPITLASAPFTGTFAPQEPISTGDGFVLAAGYDWGLRIEDDTPGNVGTLTSFSITVNYAYSGTVRGTNFDDEYLSGSNAADKMYGLSGSDRMFAHDGNDTLVGDAGQDRLFGGRGNDLLIGGNGKDFLAGEADRDILRGGSGADRFDMEHDNFRDFIDFNAIAETGKTATTRDVIELFERGDDKIDLATIDASTTVAGKNAFKFIGTQGFHHVAGELRYQSFNRPGAENDKVIISGDVNGDARVDFQIEVTGTAHLGASDFLL